MWITVTEMAASGWLAFLVVPILVALPCWLVGALVSKWAAQ